VQPAGADGGAPPLRLLLVEDNASDAKLLVRELRRAGDREVVFTRVEDLKSLDEALATGSWDMIVSDYSLPTLDAPRVLARLRETNADIPCIVVSGTADEATAASCMRAGAFDFVVKGQFGRLVPAIERELRERATRASVTNELRNAESSFRTVIERLPEAVIVHRDFVVQYSNPAASLLFGYPDAGAMLGMPLERLVVPSDVEGLRRRSNAILDDGVSSPWIEGRLARRNGTFAEAEASATRVVFDGQQSVLVLFRDMSERRAMTAKLMQIDRMVSAGTLAAGVGHEINNPLAYVSANLEWLAEELRTAPLDPAKRDEIIEVLQDCRTGALRIRDIVRGLQTFARAHERSSGPVDLRPLIDSAVSMAANELKHRARVTVEHEGMPLVESHDSRLGQVFLNLIVNAAHAIREGARAENEIRIRSWSDGKSVFVSVTDTGTGIGPGDLPRIFDPFFTTKPVGEGTGLGLAICREIVSALGGDVTVETELGRGSTFLVRLPPARDIESSLLVSVDVAEHKNRRAKVLVVDDEALLGSAFQRVLEDEHDIVFVASGKVAMERLRSGETFDVVFVDLMMPDVSGIDLCAFVEATRPELSKRVIVMTGGAYTAASRELVANLKVPPLSKPLDFEEVRRRIDALIA
jgi:PAS domain S-box-containing protein